ncbi:MAG: ATP-binding protein [Magnetococcus sp. WYHC-3]
MVPTGYYRFYPGFAKVMHYSPVDALVLLHLLSALRLGVLLRYWERLLGVSYSGGPVAALAGFAWLQTAALLFPSLLPYDPDHVSLWEMLFALFDGLSYLFLSHGLLSRDRRARLTFPWLALPLIALGIVWGWLWYLAWWEPWAWDWGMRLIHWGVGLPTLLLLMHRSWFGSGVMPGQRGRRHLAAGLLALTLVCLLGDPQVSQLLGLDDGVLALGSPLVHLLAGGLLMTAGFLLSRAMEHGEIMNWRRLSQAHRQNDYALEMSERKYHVLFHNIPDAALLADTRTGVILDMNQTAEAMLGRDLSLSAGLCLGDLVEWPDSPGVVVSNPRSPADVAPSVRDGTLVRPDGERLPVRVWSLELELDRWTLTQTLMRPLPTEVHQVARGEISRSHPLTACLESLHYGSRGPLQALLGRVELLEKVPVEPGVHAWIGELRQHGQCIAQVLRDVSLVFGPPQLPASRPGHTFDILHLVELLLEHYRPQARGKGLALRHEMAAGMPPRLVGDRDALEDLLRRLLDNAVRYTDQGEVVLKVLPEGESAAARFRFEVRDTGTGLSRERLRGLFHADPMAAVRRCGGESAGLGIAVARSLARSLGGELMADSRMGVGTVVWVVLTLGYADASGTVETMLPEHAYPDESTGLDGRLLADLEREMGTGSVREMVGDLLDVMAHNLPVLRECGLLGDGSRMGNLILRLRGQAAKVGALGVEKALTELGRQRAELGEDATPTAEWLEEQMILLEAEVARFRAALPQEWEPEDESGDK